MVATVLAYLYPAADPRTDYRVVADGSGERIQQWNPALGPQPTPAELGTAEASAGFQAYIAPSAIAQRFRVLAASGLDADATPPYKILRGTAAVLVDEINLLREWIVAFKAATAAATSLANLQTRVAALPDLPDRTVAQAKTAIQNKITAGAVD